VAHTAQRLTVSGAPELIVARDATQAAERAADWLAAALAAHVAARGRASLAISGGRTPQKMLEILAREPLPWENIHVLQVDERVAPSGHADRNATQAAAAFAKQLEQHPERFHWMPVEDPSLTAASGAYARTLREVAGEPPMLDIVHLGLGADGHTASLFPGSPLVDETGTEVAVTGEHLGRRRMTLTLPVLNRARQILWVVTGADKAAALARMLAADPTVVASRVRQSGAVVVADVEAARAIP
jgi:6-phosphogluconolactonase